MTYLRDNTFHKEKYKEVSKLFKEIAKYEDKPISEIAYKLLDIIAEVAGK